MAIVKITRQADADLADIWDYTAAHWGQSQARKYLTQLEQRFLFLAKRPEQGRLRYDLPGFPLSYHQARHVIFYRKFKDGVEIVRILHDSMDFPRHLR